MNEADTDEAPEVWPLARPIPTAAETARRMRVARAALDVAEHEDRDRWRPPSPGAIYTALREAGLRAVLFAAFLVVMFVVLPIKLLTRTDPDFAAGVGTTILCLLGLAAAGKLLMLSYRRIADRLPWSR